MKALENSAWWGENLIEESTIKNRIDFCYILVGLQNERNTLNIPNSLPIRAHTFSNSYLSSRFRSSNYADID